MSKQKIDLDMLIPILKHPVGCYCPNKLPISKCLIKCFLFEQCVLAYFTTYFKPWSWSLKNLKTQILLQNKPVM